MKKRFIIASPFRKSWIYDEFVSNRKEDEDKRRRLLEGDWDYQDGTIEGFEDYVGKNGESPSHDEDGNIVVFGSRASGKRVAAAMAIKSQFLGPYTLSEAPNNQGWVINAQNGKILMAGTNKLSAHSFLKILNSL